MHLARGGVELGVRPEHGEVVGGAGGEGALGRVRLVRVRVGVMVGVRIGVRVRVRVRVGVAVGVGVRVGVRVEDISAKTRASSEKLH